LQFDRGTGAAIDDPPLASVAAHGDHPRNLLVGLTGWGKFKKNFQRLRLLLLCYANAVLN
jgi:hypothetical protein